MSSILSPFFENFQIFQKFCGVATLYLANLFLTPFCGSTFCGLAAFCFVAHFCWIATFYLSKSYKKIEQNARQFDFQAVVLPRRQSSFLLICQLLIPRTCKNPITFPAIASHESTDRNEPCTFRVWSV